jgi:hypothetical protein
MRRLRDFGPSCVQPDRHRLAPHSGSPSPIAALQSAIPDVTSKMMKGIDQPSSASYFPSPDIERPRGHSHAPPNRSLVPS